jgi:hypothetical protein
MKPRFRFEAALTTFIALSTRRTQPGPYCYFARHLEQPDCTCESGLKYSSTAERATSGPRIGRMDIAAIVKLLRR